MVENMGGSTKDTIITCPKCGNAETIGRTGMVECAWCGAQWNEDELPR